MGTATTKSPWCITIHTDRSTAHHLHPTNLTQNIVIAIDMFGSICSLAAFCLTGGTKGEWIDTCPSSRGSISIFRSFWWTVMWTFLNTKFQYLVENILWMTLIAVWLPQQLSCIKLRLVKFFLVILFWANPFKFRAHSFSYFIARTAICIKSRSSMKRRQ